MGNFFKSNLVKSIAACLVITVALAGCGRNLKSNVRTSSAVTGKVLEGIVLNASAVIIKDSDSLKNTGVGTIGGAALGGVSGSGIGKGTGSAAAAVGGALLGGILGSYIEDELSTSEGFEYLVKIDPKYMKEHQNILKRVEQIKIGRDTVDNEIKDSVAVQTTSTSVISVVQQDDVMLQPGQRVYIIYNEDRPRIIAQ